MKIGIVGGTFDPPHYGHLLIANEALHALKLDCIWFLPNQEPPHKKKSGSTTNEQRVQMLQLAIEGMPQFQIQPIEMERSGPSYTYETLKKLNEMYPDDELYFIIGADMVEYLPNWHRIDEVLQMATFVGVNRPTYKNQTDYPIQYLQVPNFDISSKMIRERMANRETVRYLMPDNIISYLKENQLYE